MRATRYLINSCSKFVILERSAALECVKEVGPFRVARDQFVACALREPSVEKLHVEEKREVSRSMRVWPSEGAGVGKG